MNTMKVSTMNDEDLPDLYRNVEWEDGCQEEHQDGGDGVEEDAGGPEEEEHSGLTVDEVWVSQQSDQAGHHNTHLTGQHTLVSDIIRYQISLDIIMGYFSILPAHAWYVVIQALWIRGDLIAQNLSS